MTAHILDGTARDAALAELTATGWHYDLAREGIAKTFTFADFSAAFGWMTRVALRAEQLDHHPEWHNVWNRVEVVLTTHRPRGFTSLDVELARAMDQVFDGR